MPSNYELFRTEDGCDRLLPSNTVQSTITYYQVTSFEYDALIDELFGSSTMLDRTMPWAERGEFTTMKLAVPAAYFAMSDIVQEATVARTVERRGLKFAAINDGTFLPVPHDIDYDDTVPRKIIPLDDLTELDRGSVSWRGTRIPVGADVRALLLADGYAFIDLPARAGGDAGQAKIVLRGRTVEISDLEKLSKSGRISIDGRARAVKLPERALDLLRAGRSAHATADGELVRLIPARITTRRVRPGTPGSPALARPATLSRSASSDVKDVFHCMRVAAVLNDRRAGAWHIPSDTLPASGTAGVSDQEFNMSLGEILADPRTEACIANLRAGPSGGLTIGAPGLPKYEIGLLTVYEQDWELLGYSKGALLSSINLAPQEELTIEIFSWDRHRQTEEQEYGSEYEFSRSVTANTNAAVTITRDLKETLSGDLNFDGRIGLPAEKVKVNAEAGFDGGVSGSVDESLGSNVELISNTTATSGEKFKSTHKVRITESAEYGTENRTTRKIRNPNVSRTLTFNYFEILENYRVSTRVRRDGHRMCVLVPNPDLGPFDLDFVLAYEHRITQILLGPAYRRGVDAARILAANRWYEDQSAIAETENLPITEPTTAAPPEEGPPSAGADKPKGIFATAETIHDILNHFINELDVGDALSLLWDHVAPIGGGSFSVGEVQEARTATKKFCFWYKIINIYPGFEDQARVYLERTAGKFGQKQHEPEVIAELRALTEFFDDDWLASIKMFAASTVAQAIMKLPILLTGPAAPFVGGILEPLILDLAYNHEDRGLSNAINRVRRDLNAIVDTQNAVIAQEQIETPAVSEVVPAQRPQVPRVYSLRELAEAHAAFHQLTSHMEAHRVYYTNEIWRAEDANERLVRLELMGLARFVENRLLGFSGTSAILPLRLDAFPEELQGALTEFLKVPETGPDGMTPAANRKEAVREIAVPTPGVHMDTLLGQCDALEPYLEERRQIDRRLAEAQADAAAERLRQQQLETLRLERTLARDLPEPDQGADASADGGSGDGGSGDAGSADGD